MADSNVAKKIQGRREKILKAQETHARKTKERAEEIAQVKHEWQNAKESPIVKDLLAKAKKYQAYHIKIAQDGVGARMTGHKLADGSAEVENYFLSNSEIAGEMKKAAGIQELVDYIERQIESEVEPPKPADTEADTEAEEPGEAVDTPAVDNPSEA